METLFSIIVPVYNAAKYLNECIDSVMKQTYSNWEMILVNDGSTDDSGIICDSFAKKDKRIKVYHQENKGALFSRRRGIEYIQGEYTLFLDADDYWANDLLERMNKIVSETNCEAIFFRMGLEIQKNNISEATGRIITKQQAMKRILEDTNNSLADKLFKTQAIKKSIQEDISEKFTINLDFVQLISIMKNINSIYELDEVLYYWRIVNNSVSHGCKPQKVWDIFTSSAWVEEELKKSEEYNKEIEKYLYIGILKMISGRLSWVYKSPDRKQWLERIYNNHIYKYSLKYEKWKWISWNQYILLKMFRYKQNWYFLKR